MKQVRVRRFEKDGAVCWGRYLYCRPRLVWVRVGCESTGRFCCAPEVLPRGAALPGSSRRYPADILAFEKLCPEERLP